MSNKEEFKKAIEELEVLALRLISPNIGKEIEEDNFPNMALKIKLANIKINRYVAALKKENEELNTRIKFLDSVSKEDKYEDWGEDR